MDADVLIQAGHEGKKRNKGSGTTASVGAGGIARPEHKMTPIVANAAAEILKTHGVKVVRQPGVFEKKFDVKLGIALHFDGSPRKCGSGASVGYPSGNPAGSNRPTAELWKEIWAEFWPFRFMKDNFTPNLSGYYGYGRMNTEIAELLIEFGEISCPEQDAWIQPRVEWMGGVVAHFVGQVLEVNIPKPLEFGEQDEGVPRVSRSLQTDPWDSDVAAVRLELAELRAQVAELAALNAGASVEDAALARNDDDI